MLHIIFGKINIFEIFDRLVRRGRHRLATENVKIVDRILPVNLRRVRKKPRTFDNIITKFGNFFSKFHN